VAKKTTANRQVASALGEEKLKTSGLTTDDAKKLKISFLNGDQTADLHSTFNALCSLKIDYLDPFGKPLPDWPGAKPFYRLRYLETPTGFDSLTTKKPVRYVQEPGTAPVAYFPANDPNWAEYVSNPSVPLVITEGELKAAKACKEGFPTIGLGGVHNWRARKLGVTWLPSLDVVKWIKRNVYICFDSDYRTNPAVCVALKQLAEELQQRGSFIHLVNLPQLPGLEKVGLDDFLVHGGPTAVDMFGEMLHLAEPLGLTAPLWYLNDKYVYVQDPGLIIDQETRFKVSPTSFTSHLEAPLTYQERVLRDDGSITFKPVSAALSWLKWPLRMQVGKLTYKPGQEKFVDGEEGRRMFNIWPGWGVQPVKGSVKPFLQLIDHIFTGAEEDAKVWFLRWLACPLQRPGIKMFTSAALHGIRHGTGKSLVGYTMGRIYGKNFTEIKEADLHSGFNEWAEGKQFVLGDDVTGSNKRQDADLLKKMITQQELRINPKYVASYVVPDCMNYLFTSNQPDAFFLEDDDRRHFIHEVTVGPLPDQFYIDYTNWLSEGGASAIFHYLLNYDLNGFNPAAHAFKTAAKERMIADVRSDLGSWVRSLVTSPDHHLKVGEMALTQDLFTSAELLSLYDPSGGTGTTANGLGRELRRAGVPQVLQGKPIRLPTGAQVRLYAIRRPERWVGEMKVATIVAHLEEVAKKGGKKDKKY
jgi:hypothetical protein